MEAEYEYQTINISLEPAPDNFRKASIETAANRWAEQGWRTVSVMPSRALGYSDSILIERKKKDSKPIAIEVEYKGVLYHFPWKEVRLIFKEGESNDG